MILKFKENRVRRAYLGGKKIDRFMGKDNPADGRYPEEWVASTATAFNPDMPKENEGLSLLEDGSFFIDLLKKEPEKLLGKRLCEKHGAEQSILVKLLDSAERLVIQCHPTVPFAKENFGSDFGKTECWYMLDTEPDACVYLGFKEGITREYWKELFDKQDVEGMLSCLHKFSVKPDELWFIEGGVPHAIGAGCFMIELQEPSDLMVIPERVTPSGVTLVDTKLHGGLGFNKMFDCFVYEGRSESETKKLYYRKAKDVSNAFSDIVGVDLTDKFSMKKLKVCGSFEVDLGDSYAVCIVTDGEGTVSTENETLDLRKGSSFFITANSGNLCFDGDFSLVMCQP